MQDKKLNIFIRSINAISLLRHLCIIILCVSVFMEPINSGEFGYLSILKIAIPLIFIIIIFYKRGKLNIPRTAWMFILFLAFTLASLVVGSNFSSILMLMIGYLVMLISIFNICESDSDASWIVRSYFLGVCTITFLCLFDYFSISSLEFFQRQLVEERYGTAVFLGFEGNPNALASDVAPAVPMAMLFIRKSKSLISKLLYLGIMIGIVFCLAMTQSRSGLLGAFLGAAVLGFFFLRPLTTAKMFFGFGLVAIVMPIFAFWIVGELSGTAASALEANLSIDGNKAQSILIRLETFPYFLQLGMNNPFTGIGYGMASQFMAEHSGHAVGAHNIFLAIWVEFGLFAFAAFTLCVLGPIFRIVNNLKPSGVVVDLLFERSATLFASNVAFLVHGMFHEIYINPVLWLLLGLTCIYNRELFLTRVREVQTNANVR